MPGLLLVVALGVPLPLGLLADGEWWEEKLLAGHVLASEVVYDQYRILDLSEQVLLAKPAKPELIDQFREGGGDPEKVKEALKQVEPVNLRGRSLRGASFFLGSPARRRLAGSVAAGRGFVGNRAAGREFGASLQRALQGADLGPCSRSLQDAWI